MRRPAVTVEKTRKGVLAGALATFSIRGIRAATFSEIAANAGVTRGAVHWHFADKQALVRELSVNLVWPLEIGADVAPFEQSSAPISLLRQRLCGSVVSWLGNPSHGQLLALLAREQNSGELPVDVVERVQESAEACVGRLSSLLSTGEARGAWKAQLPTEQIAMALQTVALSMLAYGYGYGLGPPSEYDVCRALCLVVSGGLQQQP